MVHQQLRPNCSRLSFDTVCVITGGALLVVGFVLYVWMELATHSMLFSLTATGPFAAFFALPSLLLLWRAPLRLKFAFISTFLLLILVVRNIEWNSRKPFMDALNQIQTGMTVAQADAVMRGFMGGPHAGFSEYGTVGYRHTDEGWGNADIGLVTFGDGRVVKVEYLPD